VNGTGSHESGTAIHRTASIQYWAWACLTTFSKSWRLMVVVVGAAVVGGVVGAGTVVGATVVGPAVVAIAAEKGDVAGADFLELPPHEARTTSVRAPAKVLNFDMRRR
jgi:anti-sigma-K factor RskA